MGFCIKCGKALDPNEKFCMKCGTPNPDMPSVGSSRGSYSNPSNPYVTYPSGGWDAGTNPPYTVPPSPAEIPCPVTLTDGEEVIKNYEVTRGLIIPLRGYLTVTNKRVVFHSKGLISNVLQESPISDIGTIQQSYGFVFRPKFLLISIVLFVICGLLSNTLGKLDIHVGWIFLLAGLVCLAFIIKPTNTLKIKTGKAACEGIQCGDDKTQGLAFSALTAIRGKDSTLLMQEIGAMIMDFQTLGDNAIDKWKK